MYVFLKTVDKVILPGQNIFTPVFQSTVTKIGSELTYDSR